MNPGDRFKQLREELGLKQREIGEKLDFKQTKVKDIEIGKQKISPEIAELVEKNLSISGWWLLTGKGNMFVSDLPPGTDIPIQSISIDGDIKTNTKQILGRANRVEIPYYDDTYASAGDGAENGKTPPPSVMSFDADFLRIQLGIASFSGLHLITAVGDSMQKTFQSGEILFVLPFESEDNHLRDNGIYVMQTPNGTIVKRIGVHPFKKAYTLRSDNDDIPPVEIEGDEVDACKIIGRVVAHFDRV